MSLLLVVRYPEAIPQAYQALNEMLDFEQSHANEMTSDREVLGAVWVDPTANILNSPDILINGSDKGSVTSMVHGCCTVDSFSLSGVWTVCRLEFDSSEFMTSLLQRETLLKLLFRYRQSAPMLDPEVMGRFVPVFENCDSEKDIHKEIRKMQLLCPGMITEFLVSHSLNGAFRIEKCGVAII